MKNPIIYKDNKEIAPTLKPVILDLRVDEDGDVQLVAVDEDGDEVTPLLTFYEGRSDSWTMAKRELERQGYDTSFCEWGALGEMKVS
jgi:hypothetical protein